jgi:hypothetical protein
LASPQILSPYPDKQTCLSLSVRLVTGKWRNLDDVENPFSAHLSLQLLDETVDNTFGEWVQFWNISNNVQDGNDGWRTSGKIFLPSEKESYIRIEARMYGGGTYVALDDLSFGCLGEVPMVPAIFPKLFKKSCSSEKWGEYGIQLFSGIDFKLSGIAPALSMALFCVIQLVSFVRKSCIAKRVDGGGGGVRLISTLPTVTATAVSDDTIGFKTGSTVAKDGKNTTITINKKNNHLKYKQTYKCAIHRHTKGRNLVGAHFPACSPFVLRPFSSSSFKSETITLSLSSLTLPKTLQRTETHVRISLFQPINTNSCIQQSTLIGETPEQEGRLVNIQGRLFKRTSIYDAPLSVNTLNHHWNSNELPTYEFPTIEAALEAKFVVYAGSAPWFLFSNHLLPEEAMCRIFSIKNMKMKEIDGTWLMGGSGLVFEPNENDKKMKEDTGESKKGGNVDDMDEEEEVVVEKIERNEGTKNNEKDFDVVNASSAWRSFVAMSLSKSHDVFAQITLGQSTAEKTSETSTTSTTISTTSTAISPLQVTIDLYSRARIKYTLEQMLNSSPFKKSCCCTRKSFEYQIDNTSLSNRVLTVSLYTNNPMSLIKDNKTVEQVQEANTEKNKRVEEGNKEHVLALFSAAIKIGYGHQASVKSCTLVENKGNSNYVRCRFGCCSVFRCRDYYCLSKSFMAVFRLLMLILLFVCNIFTLTYTFFRTSIKACCVLLAWLWSRSITIDPANHCEDGVYPKGKIVIGRVLTCRHDFRHVSKERMLYVFRTATVINVLRGRRLVVLYEQSEEEKEGKKKKKKHRDTVKWNAVRELNSVPESRLRGSYLL